MPRLEWKNNPKSIHNFGAQKSPILLMPAPRIFRGFFHTRIEPPNAGAAAAARSTDLDRADLRQRAPDLSVMPRLAIPRIAPAPQLGRGCPTIVGNQAASALAHEPAKPGQRGINRGHCSSDGRAAAVGVAVVDMKSR
jgi:hypothetical protein